MTHEFTDSSDYDPDAHLVALRPAVLAELHRLRLWLRRRRLTLAEAVEQDLEPAGLVVLSLPRLASARQPAAPWDWPPE